MRAIALMTLPLFALAACNQSAPTAESTDTVTTETTADATSAAMPPLAAPDPVEYVAKAGAGDMFEIESSKAILKTSNNPDLKKFAQEMITAHTDSTAKIKAAVAKAKLTVKPPMLDADQQAMLTAIKAATGTEADKLYLADQHKAHDAALALHQSYADTGTTPELKAVASEIVQVVQSHITMLNGMDNAAPASSAPM